MKDVNLVSKHRLTELKKLFEVDVKKSEEQTDAPYLKNNVWSVFLMDGEVLDRNLQTKVDYSINRTETQKNVFTYYHFRTTQNVFEIGDYIIQFKKIGGEMKIFFPARCIKIEPITDNLSLVHLAHKGNHVAIHWNQLKSSVLDLDLNPVHKKIEQKQKVLERLYHYFNL